jgi:hypothetical protein
MGVIVFKLSSEWTGSRPRSTAGISDPVGLHGRESVRPMLERIQDVLPEHQFRRDERI